MDVVSACVLPAASLCWQPRAGMFALTIVCKATFLLRPGESSLAGQQPPPLAADVPFRGDPHGALAAAGDLAPFKPRCDVVVVGSAHAPGGRAVVELAARLIVGSVDKTVEARTAVPALAIALRAGALGPIAASWPMRVARLPRHLSAWDPRLLTAEPLPTGLDPLFFNVAPPDQQLAALRADEALSLLHLHPEHAWLTTRLVAVVPVAIVERPEAPLENIVFRCDTLVIDADHGLASLTWRATIPLTSAGEVGRVVVMLESQRSVEAQAGDVMQKVFGGLAATNTPFPEGAAVPHRRGPADAGMTVNSFVASRPIAAPASPLPFQAAAVAPTPATLTPAAPSLLRRRGPEGAGMTMGAPAAHARPALPFDGSLPPAPASALAAAAVSPSPLPAPQPAQDLEPDERSTAPVLLRALPEPPALLQIVASPSLAEQAEGEDALPFEAYPSSRCAGIAASMARRREDFAAILEGELLDAALWARLDRHWAAVLSADLERGESASLDAYDAAYVARLEAERGLITPGEYGRLALGAERGRVATVLTELSLPRGAMPRIDRIWIRRQSEDPALAEAVRSAIRAGRPG